MQSMRKLLDLLGIDVPVIQAPMAGASSAELVAAVANAGGLGSYGCSRLSPAQVIEEAERIRALTNRSFNLGFFCHDAPEVTPEQERAWRSRLAPYYSELGVDPASASAPNRAPFDEEICDAVVAAGPKVASFHFGLPEPRLVAAHPRHLASERAPDPIAGRARNLHLPALHAGSGPPPCIAIDDQTTIRHQPAGLVADIAFDDDLAAGHVLPDLIEAIGAPLNANALRVAGAHPEDVADGHALPPGLQFELADLGGRLVGQTMRDERGKIEPLVRIGPQGQDQRSHR